MDAKAQEANRPPPTYDETQQQQQSTGAPTFVSQPLPEAQAQNNGPVNSEPTINGETGRRIHPTMFITARTSVYGPNPVEMDCPHCQAHIVTHISRIAGVLPWIICGICFVLGLFLILIPWCFCCIPFFCDQCLDVLHNCPSCKRFLGRYSRM